MSRATRYNTSIVASPFSLVKKNQENTVSFFSLFLSGFLFCFFPRPSFLPESEQKGRLNEENKTEGGKKMVHTTRKSRLCMRWATFCSVEPEFRDLKLFPLRPPRPSTPLVLRPPYFSPYRRSAYRLIRSTA